MSWGDRIGATISPAVGARVGEAVEAADASVEVPEEDDSGTLTADVVESLRDDLCDRGTWEGASTPPGLIKGWAIGETAGALLLSGSAHPYGARSRSGRGGWNLAP